MMNDDNNDEDAGDHDHVDDVGENHHPKQTWQVRPQAVRTHSLMYLIRPSQHCEQFDHCHVKISNCGMMMILLLMICM